MSRPKTKSQRLARKTQAATRGYRMRPDGKPRPRDLYLHQERMGRRRVLVNRVEFLFRLPDGEVLVGPDSRWRVSLAVDHGTEPPATTLTLIRQDAEGELDAGQAVRSDWIWPLRQEVLGG